MTNLKQLRIKTGFELSNKDKVEIQYCQSSKEAHKKAELTQIQAESLQDDIDIIDLGARNPNIADIIEAKKNVITLRGLE